MTSSDRLNFMMPTMPMRLLVLPRLDLESPVQPSTAFTLQTVLASLMLSYTLAAFYISLLWMAGLPKRALCRIG